MEMHKINYEIKLTGSKLFDIVMFNTAKQLCTDYPGLNFKYDTEKITIYGELSDMWYEKYQKEMFD